MIKRYYGQGVRRLTSQSLSNIFYLAIFQFLLACFYVRSFDSCKVKPKYLGINMAELLEYLILPRTIILNMNSGEIIKIIRFESRLVKCGLYRLSTIGNNPTNQNLTMP